MNEISTSETIIFQNAKLEPLEKLNLTFKNSGIVQTIPALDKHWIGKRLFLNYEPLYLFDSEGKNIVGAKERWFEIASFILEDLSWLLHLPFYKFWSNIIYNPSIIDSITTFLQEAPIFYTLENFPNDNELKEHFSRIRQNVLIVFARLITNKESASEYISLSKHADLIYNKYIFTVPILMDLCQQYGRDNKNTIEKIVNSVFTLQPLYKDDLGKAVTFIMQVLKNIESRFKICPAEQENQAIPLLDKDGANIETTLPTLEDLILYLLDTISTISIFINIYPPAITNFKVEHFITNIISIYGNIIPVMYKKVDDLVFHDKTIAKYTELRYRLDVARIEILNTYRTIIYKNIRDISENKNSVSLEMGEIVEDFLTNLMYILSEKEFVIDYHHLYPVTDDIQKLLEIYSDLDIVRCQFILNSIFTFLDEPSSLATSVTKVTESCVAGSSCTQNNKSTIVNEETNIAGPSKISYNNKYKIASLIAEVKDILCDLGEGFIERCLKYYNYNKETVINAVLEDSLPIELKSLDHLLPYIPPDPEESLASVDAAIGMERLNIYDNDEFDVMINDVMDTSRIYKGKKKDKYKNCNDLLNDKTHIAAVKDIYNKYSIVTSEYNDEYDDTYDDYDVGSNAQDVVMEEDARPFTIPRVLCKPEANLIEVEEENEFESISESCLNKDHFLQDPAILRAKAKERQLSKQATRTFKSRRNSKSQRPMKEVLENRNQKNKSKEKKNYRHNHSMAPL